MTGFSSVHDGGAYVRSARALGNTTVETEQNSAWMTRLDATKGIALSAKLVIAYSAVLAANEQLSVAVQFQDATDATGSDAADYAEPAQAFVVATGATGGSTEAGTAEVDIDLAGAREFIRAQTTVVTSGTGTEAYSAIMLFFGDQRGPSTKSPVNLASADAI